MAKCSMPPPFPKGFISTLRMRFADVNSPPARIDNFLSLLKETADRRLIHPNG